MGKINDVEKKILEETLNDFASKQLGLEALGAEYAGVPIQSLRKKHCSGDQLSKVDFDLALKQLEEKGLVRTGPMVPYENDSNAVVVVIGLFSKREFCCLTEKGYMAAR